MTGDNPATNGRDENPPIIAVGTVAVVTLSGAKVRRSEGFQFGPNGRAFRGVMALDGVVSPDNTAAPLGLADFAAMSAPDRVRRSNSKGLSRRRSRRRTSIRSAA
jgi:hypothetical protein